MAREVAGSRALVVGAGIVGAACARELSRAGFEVTVVERGAVCGGTSVRCEGNILVSDKPPGPELMLALDAAERWPRVAAELADELGRDFPDVEYQPKGGLVVSTTAVGAASLRRFAAQQRDARVLAEDLEPDEARDLERYLTPSLTGAVRYPQDAQVEPVAATEALIASARRAGTRVLLGCTVTGALSAGGRITGLRTTDGDLEADIVVNAAGPWAGEVAAACGAPIPVLPRRGTVLVTTRQPDRVRHKVYDADYVGATQSADAALQVSTVVEATRAGTLLIGSSRERVGFDPSLDVAVVAALASRAVRLFPFLADVTLMRSYVGFRPYLPDHLPLIGEDHRRPGLFHVTGHEGAGIGLSVSSAALLVALVTGAAAPVPAAPFAPVRPTLLPFLSDDAA